MTETLPTSSNEKDSVLNDRERFHMVAATALRATMRQKSESLKNFNELADEKAARLDEDLHWSSPGQQDEGDKLARQYAAETYLGAAQDSGLAAAELRRAEKKAKRVYEENEGVYVDAATKLANADLAAQGKPSLNR